MIDVFYDEPDPDRWIKGDRVLRKFIRYLVRGPKPPSGMMRYFLNLIKGFDQLGVHYLVNDFNFLKNNRDKVACVIGKGFLLEERKWENNIVFGPAVYAHPLDNINLPQIVPIKKVLVSCDWTKRMFEPYWGDLVDVWPSGVDTDQWIPETRLEGKVYDVLVYDKIRWNYEAVQESLIDPIYSNLKKGGLTFTTLRYGFYKEEDYLKTLKQCRSMIFLCEHETQGFAYLQALSSGIPIFALDKEGVWEDPCFYPERVKFYGTSSVPYWDNRCGMKFKCIKDFQDKFDFFFHSVKENLYAPREYVVENLNLKLCATKYLEIIQEVQEST